MGTFAGLNRLGIWAMVPASGGHLTGPCPELWNHRLSWTPVHEKTVSLLQYSG